MNKKTHSLFIFLLFVMLIISMPALGQGETVLTIGYDVEPITLDPQGGIYIPEQFVIQQLFDSLVYYDPEMTKLYPGLATEWSQNDDATEFTFKLRADVKFHDGTPFNAQAVQVAMDRAAIGMTPAAASISLMADYIETVAADDFTVTVKFGSPHATFLEDLTRPWLMISSPTAIEKYGADFGQHPVGTGPFQLESWAEQDHITLVKNPDYSWGPEFLAHDGATLLDTVTLRILPEAASRMTAFQSGEVDITKDPESSQVAGLTDVQLFTFVSPGMASHQMINTEKSPTNDIRVRQAMIYAVDQETIAEVGFFDLVQPAHSVISPSTWAYNEEAGNLYHYDPEKAAALLDEAGWVDTNGDGIREKDGENLHLEYIALPVYEEGFMDLLASYLKDAGFDVNVIKLDDAGITAWGYEGKHNLLNMGWISRDPAILAFVYDSGNIVEGTQSAYTRFKNDRLDEILRTAPQTIDVEKRKAMYEEAQMIIMENAIALPIHCYGNVYVASDRVNGFRFDSEGYPYLYEISLNAE